jgi:hypothetical protein
MNRSAKVRSRVGFLVWVTDKQYDWLRRRRNVLSVFLYEVDYEGQMRPS